MTPIGSSLTSSKTHVSFSTIRSRFIHHLEQTKWPMIRWTILAFIAINFIYQIIEMVNDGSSLDPTNEAIKKSATALLIVHLFLILCLLRPMTLEIIFWTSLPAFFYFGFVLSIDFDSWNNKIIERKYLKDSLRKHPYHYFLRRGFQVYLWLITALYCEEYLHLFFPNKGFINAIKAKLRSCVSEQSQEKRTRNRLSLLLYRYGNWTDQSIGVTISVFIAWFFSFIVIFILPLDISSTAYRQCLLEVNATKPVTTTTTTTTTTTSTTTVAPPSNVTDFHNITALPISNTTGNDTSGNDDDERLIEEICGHPWSYAQKDVLLTLWGLVYWSIQALTWGILPIMQSYSMAGDFTKLGKIKSAFVANAIYYGSFAIIFFIILIYVALRTSLGWAELKVICTTASNTWGLFLLVVLLGYGLVEIPRSCFNTSLHGRTQTYVYFKVAKLSVEKIEAEERLEDVLDEINYAYQAISPNNTRFRSFINEILDKCPNEWRNNLLSRYQNLDRSSSAAIRSSTGTVYTEKSLIRMNQQIKKAVQDHHRVHCQWNNLIDKAIDWEDVSRNQLSASQTFKPTLKRPQPESTLLRFFYDNLYSPRIEWYWKCAIRGPFFRCLAYVTGALSLMVIWSEMTFSIHHPPLSIFASIFISLKSSHNYFFIEFISIMSIAYLCVCTYYSVFKIRIFNYYYLAPHHQTDEYSLIFSGMLLCRLTPPLCLNILGLINLDSHITKTANQEEASFTKVMGHMDVVPLIRDGFNIYLPIVMCIFCMATFLQFGSRLLHFMGIEQFIMDDETTSELIREGKELVTREKNKKIRLTEGSNLNRGERRGLTGYSSTRSTSNRNQSGFAGGDIEDSTPRIDRSSDYRDTGKTELLDDVEPIDYSSLTSTPKDSYQSFEPRQPPKNLFDDV